VFEENERRAIDDAAEAWGLQFECGYVVISGATVRIWMAGLMSERSSAIIEVSVMPPMKKTMTNSSGVICFPGRRPAIRIVKTRKQ